MTGIDYFESLKLQKLLNFVFETNCVTLKTNRQTDWLFTFDQITKLKNVGWSWLMDVCACVKAFSRTFSSKFSERKTS